MVTQSIGGAPAAAGARRCGKGHAQAAEEDYAEQLARQPELCGRGQNNARSRSENSVSRAATSVSVVASLCHPRRKSPGSPGTWPGATPSQSSCHVGLVRPGCRMPHQDSSRRERPGGARLARTRASCRTKAVAAACQRPPQPRGRPSAAGQAGAARGTARASAAQLWTARRHRDPPRRRVAGHHCGQG